MTPRFKAKDFFDAIRPHMRGRKLKASQVQGIEAILTACTMKGLAFSHIAYVLATAFHETGGLMWPVREGFCKTDAGSRRAVKALFDKGIIRWNYALPEKNGHSYYGRGFVQLTHMENYAKTGKALGYDLVGEPDIMLNPRVSAEAMVWGMVEGAYRKHTLSDKLPVSVDPTDAQWRSARMIINGDTRKNGTRIAKHAKFFYEALKGAAE